MTIASEITRLQNDKAAICTAIENKGVTVGSVTFDSYAACIDAIPTGSSFAIVDMLLIGGGGGGGCSFCYYQNGGGGGAGGVVYSKHRGIGAGSYCVTIGEGGASMTNGGDSCFDGEVALGGGRGGHSSNGCDGGSGGGGTGGCIGGKGTSMMGNDGGNGCYCSQNSQWFGGGGGGGGGMGCVANNGGGGGGLGICVCITGQYECFAGGGGGGPNASGCYGGGNAGGGSVYAASGYPATTCGSGGGGAMAPGYSSRRCPGGQGGGGLLVIAYPTACGYSITGGTCYTCGNYTIHCFTSSGTLVVS